MLPALVLNADYKPLSLFPLSVWNWKDVVSAVISDRVDVVDVYAFQVHSPSLTIDLPSVIALRRYENMNRPAALTRANLFVRDNWTCQFCNEEFPTDKLTFDHVLPRSRGGSSTWTNLVASCGTCNLRKKDMTPKEAKMKLRREPFHPTVANLRGKSAYRKLNFNNMHESWIPWVAESKDLGRILSEREAVRSSTNPAFPPGVTDSMYWNVDIEEG